MEENTGNDIEESEGLYEQHRFKADKGQEPMRIDKFLHNRIEGISRNKIQNAAKEGQVFVNGSVVKSNHKIQAGDDIRIMLTTPAREFKLEAEDIPIDVVYEDEHLAVVNKPAGLVVHPGSGNYTGTLVNGLLHHFDELAMKADRTRPGLVHRIDKNTSGLLVIAKTERALTHLSEQFFEKTTERKYHALVWGDLPDDEGKVDVFIGRDQRYRKKMAAYPDGDFGKAAVTHYKVLERFGYTTLIECELETGRTHQIRVHMKHLNSPLFNDDTYGGDRIVKGTIYSKYKQFVENCFQLMPRQALHAKSLGFVHPETGKEMLFESELPEDFTAVLEKWRGYYKYALRK
ncbi:MAG: RluA family pseudouridine synthase [Chitinophagales bacterium]